MYKTRDDLVVSGMQLFDRYVNSLTDDLARSYFVSHRARFERTLSYVPSAGGYGHAVELGATDFFQVSLRVCSGTGLFPVHK